MSYNMESQRHLHIFDDILENPERIIELKFNFLLYFCLYLYFLLLGYLKNYVPLL